MVKRVVRSTSVPIAELPSPKIRSLVEPGLATRQALFDFVVEEPAAREPQDARSIRPVRVARQNQRDRLALASVLDANLAGIAQAAGVPTDLMRAACLLCRKPITSLAYWKRWGRQYDQKWPPSSTPSSALDS